MFYESHFAALQQMSQGGSEATEERFLQRQECEGVNIKTSEDRAPDWTGYGGEDDDGIMDTAMFLVLVIRSI